MKTLLLLSLAILTSCSHNSKKEPEEKPKAPAISFENKKGCFILYDMKKNSILKQEGGNCEVKLTPCSTFKVPLALMSFDSGVLKNENQRYKWNKKKYSIDTWNKNQTATSWMKNSVVWYSQRLTPQLGLKKIKKYLEKFDYGNQDMSSGIMTSWLTNPIGKEKPGSLKISALEQMDFVKHLWKSELGVSPKATELTKKITYLETSPKGYILHGKTGSGHAEENENLRIGWFIAHIMKGDEEYITILNFTDTVAPAMPGYGGMEAKAATIEFYKEHGLW